jgi:hypothetical protein
MNGSGNGCRRQRQNISLLASGALAGAELRELEEHLALCESCRVRLQEIRAVTMPLEQLKKTVAQIEPDVVMQKRWDNSIRIAAAQKTVHSAPGNLLQELWLGLIWPCRHAWTGIIALWIIMAAINWERPKTVRSSEAANVAATTTFLESAREEQRLLTELIPLAPASPADVPRRNDGPRTEWRATWAAC